MLKIHIQQYIYIDHRVESNGKLNLELCKNAKIQRGFCKSLYSELVRRNFGIKNVKNVLPQTYFSDLNAKKNVGTAYGEKLQKPNQKQVRIEELMKKKKVTNYKSSGKVLINHLIAAYI